MDIIIFILTIIGLNVVVSYLLRYLSKRGYNRYAIYTALLGFCILLYYTTGILFIILPF